MEKYRGFDIVFKDDCSCYFVYKNGECCGYFHLYSDALDCVDKFYKYFGGSFNVTL